MDPIISIIVGVLLFCAKKIGEKTVNNAYDSLKEVIKRKVKVDPDVKDDDLKKLESEDKKDLEELLMKIEAGKDSYIINEVEKILKSKEFDELTRNHEIPVELIHNAKSRLPNEVFAVELLKRDIFLQKDEKGHINATIDRNDVETAVITTSAKEAICKKYVTAGRRGDLIEKDNEIHKFLIGKSDKKKMTIDLTELPLRWASGGVFSIVNFKERTWTPFFFRDITPVGWNIALGASERYFINDGELLENLDNELNEPWKFIAREFLEETLVLNRKPKEGDAPTFKKFCFDIANVKLPREKAIKFAKKHIDCRKKADHLFFDINALKETEEYKADYDINVDIKKTNTSLRIIKDGKHFLIQNVMICFNLLELGIEVIKIIEYDLQESDYILDGEIYEHKDGTKELVRMPIALISHEYLKKTFGYGYDLKLTDKCYQPSVIGEPIPEKDIEIFDWDIIQRVNVLNGEITGFGEEKKRYQEWINMFGKNFLDRHNNPVKNNPSRLFTPASVKIINSYFSYHKPGKR